MSKEKEDDGNTETFEDDTLLALKMEKKGP